MPTETRRREREREITGIARFSTFKGRLTNTYQKARKVEQQHNGNSSKFVSTEYSALGVVEAADVVEGWRSAVSQLPHQRHS